MAGLIGYIGALADDLSAVATKVAAGSLDDIASQTGKSLSKTAGILIDDTATIPQYVSNTAAKRELPVIWKIAKKSLRNKALMIPIAILITYFAPWIMAPILVLGGSYLAYEGTESLGEKLGLIKEHGHSNEHSIPNTDDLTAAEDKTVASAVRTDTILSIEIIALTIATVVNEPIVTQVGVLVLIGLIATIGVYGIVGMIIKMDDMGFYLRDAHAKNQGYQLISKLLILGMPKVMNALGFIGMVAMLMVGGGILMHNLPFLHELNHLGVSLPSVLPIFMEYFVIPITIALSMGAGILAFKRLLTSKHN
jgi:predicted DNA repair protein MutK